MRPLILAALAALAVTPAFAQSELSLDDISRLYCEALVAADMATVTAVLTPDLATTIENRTDVTWQGVPGTVTACRQVGASGSFDHPEAVLFYTLADGKTGSDSLVLSFIDEQIRIDDVAFASGGSLRGKLAQ
jgi:hypothetical protein